MRIVFKVKSGLWVKVCLFFRQTQCLTTIISIGAMLTTVRARLLMLVSVSLVAIVIVAAMGLFGLKKDIVIVNALYNDRIVPLRDLKVIADMYAVNVVDISHKLRNGNITAQAAKQGIEQARSVIDQKWTAYLGTVLVPEEEAAIAKIKPMLLESNRQIDYLISIVEANDMPALTQFTINKLYPTIDPISEEFAKLIEIQLDVAGKDFEQMQAAYSSSRNSILLVFVLSLFILLPIAFVTIKNLGLSLASMLSAIQQASRGNFATRVAVAGKDEVAALGKPLNDLMSKLELAVSETNSVVESLAQGEFTARMSGDYEGDLHRLKEGMNHSLVTIESVMAELSKVTQALKTGEFKANIVAQAAGSYAVMLKDASEAMQSFDTVIQEINQAMFAMSQGSFDARVLASAHGELLEAKNSINASMEAIANAIHGISEVVGAQALGDLTKELPSGVFKGQLHALKNAINFSSDKVRSTVVQAVQVSNIVHDAAAQVTQGSSDLSTRVQEQAAALEETSATMNEMAAAVQANTANARKVADLAHQVQHQSEDGSVVMLHTIEAMQSIKESSSRISDIVGIIDGIAFQTNLLALNAAVEAARAGEHGRGFAVVASEVRALAGKSADAAKDIKVLIEESVARVAKGTTLAEQSGEVLNVITGSIEQVAEMIEAIAHASNEQSIGINQVNKAIADIDVITQQNAALVEQTTAAAESLNNEANELRQNMAFFKVGQANSNLPKAAPRTNEAGTKDATYPVVKSLPAAKKWDQVSEWQEF